MEQKEGQQKLGVNLSGIQMWSFNRIAVIVKIDKKMVEVISQGECGELYGLSLQNV